MRRHRRYTRFVLATACLALGLFATISAPAPARAASFCGSLTAHVGAPQVKERAEAGQRLPRFSLATRDVGGALIHAEALELPETAGAARISARRAADALAPLALAPPPIAMVATAYDGSAACNGHWGAVDYFGDPLRFGDVAVDPAVIPLGTRLFISGYADPDLPAGGFFATAVDTGGAIRGDRIDIFMASATQAQNFGIRGVKVTVLR
ncbi:MAG: 3D domain-containing protein [Firmicutes bacterium]|nr:3D domain-containing protein [Bacillota bacterium]